MIRVIRGQKLIAAQGSPDGFPSISLEINSGPFKLAFQLLFACLVNNIPIHDRGSDFGRMHFFDR